MADPDRTTAGRAGPAATARFARHILVARIRSDWQYRTSFLSLLASQAAVVTLDLAAVLLTVRLVPSLGGWTGPEVAFLFGVGTLAFGVADVTVSAVESVPTHVRTGSFDRILLRPVSPLVQVCTLDFQLRRIGRVVTPLAVLAWAVPRVEIGWGPATVARLALMVGCGAAIHAAVWVASASLSFWIVDSQQAANAATYGGVTANQFPMHLYRPWIRLVLGWVVPLGFVAYVPSLFLLGAANPLGLPWWYGWLPAPVAGLSCLVAGLVWRSGLAHYRSTGS